MKKFGKLLCLTLGILFMLCFGVACGDVNKKANKTTLVVWAPSEDMAFARQVADDFKAAHPEKNYEFQWAEQSERDSATKVLTDVENAADVFSFANDQLNRLIVGDALSQIGGSRLDKMKAENTEDAVAAATVNIGGTDKTYAFPYTDNTFFLYYNKSKFTEDDIKSLDKILAKCSKTEQFAYPMNDGWYSTAFYFGKGLGYEVTYSDKLAETKVTIDFNNDVGLNVTNSMWRYVKMEGFKADSDDSKLTAGFQDGSIIAGVSGIWNRGKIEQYLGDNFGVAKLPAYTYVNGQTEEQVQLVAFAGYKLIGVNKHSPCLADAVAFAEFYTNRENQIKHFDARGFVPTNKQAQSDPKVTNDVCAKAIQAQLEYSKTQKGVPTAIYAALEGLGNNMITAKTNNKEFEAKKQIDAVVEAVAKG